MKIWFIGEDSKLRDNFKRLAKLSEFLVLLFFFSLSGDLLLILKHLNKINLLETYFR